MKQKTLRGFCRKVQKKIRIRKRICQNMLSENGSKKRTERLTGGSHPSGLDIQTRETGLVGARELRWSPTAIHGEARGMGGTSVFSTSFRVGGWWWWSPASTVSMAALAPADGGSGSRGPRQRELLGSNWCGG